MPISTRFVPLLGPFYVPVVWLTGERLLVDLKSHAWPRPLEDTWIDLNDYDPVSQRVNIAGKPVLVADWLRRIESEP
jgi:hypothetical protein